MTLLLLLWVGVSVRGLAPPPHQRHAGAAVAGPSRSDAAPHYCHVFLEARRAYSSSLLVMEAVPTTTSPRGGDGGDEEEEENAGGGRLTDSSSSMSMWEGLRQDWTMRSRIFQESQSKGYNFKQSIANVLAGEYDEAEIQRTIEEQMNSAPCVMFTWERSPSCVQAKKALALMGILDQVVEIPLDKPWEEGHPIRAELGKKVGRTSVPAIFIGGKYVGGFDAGVSQDAPGIQAMAFQGTLRPALQAAGVEFPSELSCSDGAFQEKIDSA